MDKSKQTQIATDFDRLIVDIAACDDLDTIQYYIQMLRFLNGLADMREVMLESVGFGAFMADRLMKRFDTKDQAHDYIVAKIVAIHECDEGEIFWEDYNEVGYCRSYRMGDRFSYLNKELATIHNVDDDDQKLHHLRIRETPPETPEWLDYLTHDEAMKNLSHLVKENVQLKAAQGNTLWKRKFAWEAVSKAKLSLEKGSEGYKELGKWLQENKALLQDEP